MSVTLTLQFQNLPDMMAALADISKHQCLANVRVVPEPAAPQVSTPATPAQQSAPPAPAAGTTEPPKRTRGPNKPKNTDSAAPAAGVKVPDPAPQAQVGNSASTGSLKTPGSDGAAPGAPAATGGESASTAPVSPVTADDLRAAMKLVSDKFAVGGNANAGLAKCSEILREHGKNRISDIDFDKEGELAAKIVAACNEAVK